MNKILLILLISFLSACSQVPRAPWVERCILDIRLNRMLCQMYKIDELGGKKRGPVYASPIMDRLVCFPLNRSWLPLIDWRDELIMWAQDQEEKLK